MQKLLSDKNLKKKIREIEIKSELINMVEEITEEITGKNISLDNIEKIMSEVFKKVREKASKQILEKQEPKELKCTGCGQKMVIKNKLGKIIKGLVDYKIKRRSFYCKKCKRYEQPLDEIIGCSGKYTLEAKKAITLLGQRTNFEEASHFLRELLGIEISPKTVENFVEEIGSKIAIKEEQKIANAFNENGYIKNYEECLLKDKKKDTAYMLMDGSMVSTREDGWKEARLGILFTRKKMCQINENRREILQKEYVGDYNYDGNSLIKFCKKLSFKANELKFQNYEKQVILGDGAKWIWDYANRDHPGCIQIVDYYHAKEYLGLALQTIKFSIDEEKEKTKKEIFDLLWDGKIKDIVRFLNKQVSTKEIEDCIRYYTNNEKRMNYGEYRKLGLEIGSGAIESAHKTVIQTRMKQAGMHWSKENVQSMLSLRAKYMSGHWEEIVENYLLAA